MESLSKITEKQREGKNSYSSYRGVRKQRVDGTIKPYFKSASCEFKIGKKKTFPIHLCLKRRSTFSFAEKPIFPIK